MKVIGSVVPVENATFYVDAYVPLRFRGHPPIRYGRIVWNVEDGKRRFLEMKVDSSTGELYAATLVAADGPIEQEPESAVAEIPGEPGIPVFDVSDHETAENPRMSAHVSESASIRITTAGRYVTILFDPRSPTNALISGRVGFLISSERLVGIRFGPHESEELRLFFEWMTPDVTG